MSAKRRRQQDQLQEKIGTGAKVKLVPTEVYEHPFAYRINCLTCPPRRDGSHWTTWDRVLDWRRDNTLAMCMARWDAHLASEHTVSN
jgi:hypothetical protein